MEKEELKIERLGKNTATATYKDKEIHFLIGRGDNCQCGDCPVLYGGDCPFDEITL